METAITYLSDLHPNEMEVVRWRYCPHCGVRTNRIVKYKEDEIIFLCKCGEKETETINK